MKHSNIVTGSVGERLAADYLRRKGYTIVRMNYRRPYGEIDIVATKGETIHFVEVKTISRETDAGISRETDDYRPEEKVTSAKLRRLQRAISSYITENPSIEDYQVDVIGVVLDRENRMARCSLYSNVS